MAGPKFHPAMNLDGRHDDTVPEDGPITRRALCYDWGRIIDALKGDDDDDELHERADVEAEEARMDPEHLDPEADHATQMFR
jgi:hypothetical protein